jgi:hypothetical protein
MIVTGSVSAGGVAAILTKMRRLAFWKFLERR